MEENLLLLYEELGGDESFGSIESFSEAIKDPTNLQVVFEEAGGEEAFGSLEALSQAIGVSSTQETPQTTVPQGTPEVVRENPNKKSTDIRMDWDAWKNDHKEEGGFFSNMADWVTGTLRPRRLSGPNGQHD
jgi:type II secretory pathway component PulC